jgi:hypothetical protein
VDQDGLAFDIAPGEIRRGAGADPDDIQVETTRRRGRRSERRVDRFEGVRLPARAERIVPIGREPLRRHLERLPVDVLETVFLEFRLGPIVDHRLVLRPGDAAPVLVPVIAALEGDRDDFLQRLLHLQPVDLQVFLIGGGHQRTRIRVVPHVPIRIKESSILRGGNTGPGQEHEDTRD